MEGTPTDAPMMKTGDGLNGEHNALVLFAAPWCMPARVYPEFDKYATFKLTDGVIIAQVKADEKHLGNQAGMLAFRR